jgi:hypothetical protein
VEITGLSSTVIDALVRVERLDGTTQVARLTPAEPGFRGHRGRILGPGRPHSHAAGIEHILLGIDHLLFVLALLLIVNGVKRQVLTITAFTLAHSITLGAATLGFVTVQGPPVEAVIALSILFVAAGCPLAAGRPGITRASFGWHLRPAAVSVLPAHSRIDCEHAVSLALLFFNVGVEAGRCCSSPQYSGCRWFRRTNLLCWAGVPVYAIGSLAAFGTIQRIAGFG